MTITRSERVRIKAQQPVEAIQLPNAPVTRELLDEVAAFLQASGQSFSRYSGRLNWPANTTTHSLIEGKEVPFRYVLASGGTIDARDQRWEDDPEFSNLDYDNVTPTWTESPLGGGENDTAEPYHDGAPHE
jgi:hypothetical protein